MKKEDIVSIIKTNNFNYPKPPFNPKKIYPEFDNFKPYNTELDKENRIYNAVRKSLYQLGLDELNYNTKKWNPFKNMISKGEEVVIKPNLVLAKHPLGEKGIECTISHASVIRPIIDYLILATNGDVKITICDVPLQQADWGELIAYSGLKDLVDYYNKKNIKINLLDLRYEVSLLNQEGIITKRVKKIGDPLGYTAVDIGKKSALMPIIGEYKKFEITDYGSGTVPKHHNPKKNEYLIPNTVLNCDLFINVPKLKTHRKAGITFALKNLIGINGNKSWIAHHRRGPPKKGGDEYPKFKFKNMLKHFWTRIKNSKYKGFASLLLKIYKKTFANNKTFAELKFEEKNIEGITEGSWYQNDTVWRCIIDINNLLFFSNKKGTVKQKKQKKYLCIGDGIISGERNGPMENTPKKTGIIISGFHPLTIDKISSEIIGFDPKKIKLIKKGANFLFEKVSKIRTVQNESNIKFNFRPPQYWEPIKDNS